MKKPTNDAVIEKIVEKTGGTKIHNKSGRVVAKLQSSSVLMYLDYYSARELPYTIDISFLGLCRSNSYQTMEEQVKIAKNINKISDHLIITVNAIMEKSLKGKKK